MNRTYLSDNDLENINELLQSGFSIGQTLNILQSSNNYQVFCLIKDRLIKGEKVSDAIVYFCKDKYKSYLNNFISFMSFNSSLNLTINIFLNIKKLNNKYLKKLIYPSMMLIVTVLGIYFFKLICFPLLSEMMKEFNADLSLSIYLERFIDGFINVLFTFILIILCTLLLGINKKQRVKLYKFIVKFKFSGIIKLFVSHEFALFFSECVKMGCSTKQSIEILKGLSNKPLINYIAYNLDKSFMIGSSMEKAFKTIYLDKSLYTFLKISMYTTNTEKILNKYLSVSELKMDKFIKNFSDFIKIFSYLTVALLLIFVYQILLLPLSIISSF